MSELNTSNDPKKITIFLVGINVAVGLVLGEALCTFFTCSKWIYLMTVVIGILIGLYGINEIYHKDLEKRILYYIIIQGLYVGISFYGMAYEKFYDNLTYRVLLEKYVKGSIMMSIIILLIINSMIICFFKQQKRKLQEYSLVPNSKLSQQIIVAQLPKLILTAIIGVILYFVIGFIVKNMFFEQVEVYYQSITALAAGILSLEFVFWSVWALIKPIK